MSKKILIGETDKSVGELVNEVLSIKGFNCFLTDKYSELLGECKNKEYRLAIVSPTFLGTIEGIEDQIDKIKANNNELKIIMISGTSKYKILVEGKIDDYLVKPFELSELIAKVNNTYK